MTLTNIINFILKSSANPEKTALTIKAGVPFIIIMLGWFGYANNQIEPLLNESIIAFVNVLAATSAAYSGILTLWGVGRKLFYSLKK